MLSRLMGDLDLKFEFDLGVWSLLVDRSSEFVIRFAQGLAVDRGF